MYVIFFLLLLAISTTRAQTCQTQFFSDDGLTGYSEGDPDACVVDGNSFALIKPSFFNTYSITGDVTYLGPNSLALFGVAVISTTLNVTLKFVGASINASDTSIEYSVFTVSPCYSPQFSGTIKAAGDPIFMKNASCSSCDYVSYGTCSIYNVTFSIPVSTFSVLGINNPSFFRITHTSAIGYDGIYDIIIRDGVGSPEHVELTRVPFGDYSTLNCNMPIPSMFPTPSCSPSQSPSVSQSESQSPSVAVPPCTCATEYFAIGSGVNASYPANTSSSFACNIESANRGMIYSFSSSQISIGGYATKTSPTTMLVMGVASNRVDMFEMRVSVVQTYTITSLTDLVFNGSFYTTETGSASCGTTPTNNPRCTQPNATAGCTTNAVNTSKTATRVVPCNSGCMLANATGYCRVFDVYMNYTTSFNDATSALTFSIGYSALTPAAAPGFSIYSVQIKGTSGWTNVDAFALNECNSTIPCHGLETVINPATAPACPTPSQSYTFSQTNSPSPLPPAPSPSPSESSCGCSVGEMIALYDKNYRPAPVIAISKGNSSGMQYKNCIINGISRPVVTTTNTTNPYFAFGTPITKQGPTSYKLFGVDINTNILSVAIHGITPINLTQVGQMVTINGAIFTRQNEGFECGDQTLILVSNPVIPIDGSYTGPTQPCDTSCPYSNGTVCAINTFTMSVNMSIFDPFPSDTYFAIYMQKEFMYPGTFPGGIFGVDIFNGASWINVSMVNNYCGGSTACNATLDSAVIDNQPCPPSPSPSQSPSPSVSPSPSMSPNEECSSPFHELRLNYYDGASKYTDYYYSEEEGAEILLEMLSNFNGTSAGTHNCTEFDRIFQADNYVSEFSILYFDVYEYANGTHSVAGVISDDSILNITFTYIQPYVLDIYLESQIIALNNTLNGIPQGGVYAGFFDSVDAYGNMCTRIRGEGVQNIGTMPMNCRVVSFNVTSNSSHACDDTCAGIDVDGYPNYSCSMLTVNCFDDFAVLGRDRTANNHSFVFFSTGSNYSLAFVQEFALTEVRVSNGGKFVPIDLIRSSAPYSMCPREYQLTPVAIDLPVCCSERYETFYHPSNNDTVIFQTQQPVECSYQQQIRSTKDEYVPYVGVSIEVEASRYISGIFMTYAYYLSPEHIQYLETRRLSSGAYNQTLYDFLIENSSNSERHMPWIPMATYGADCNLQVPACNTGDDNEIACFLYAVSYASAADITLDDLEISKCPSIYNVTRNADSSIDGAPFAFNATAGFIMIGYISYNVGTFSRPFAYEDTIFTLQWPDFFPDDFIMIVSMELVENDIGTAGFPSYNKRMISIPCIGNNRTEPICECFECTRVKTDVVGGDLGYMASPLIVDNNLLENRKGTRGRFARRSDGQSADFPTSANLYGFVNETFTMDRGTADLSRTDIRNLSVQNNCGVLMHVDECTGNLQVWLSPNANVSTQNVAAPYRNYSIINCYIVTGTVFVEYPFALTENVYVEYSTNWIYEGMQSLISVNITSSSYAEDPHLRFSQGLYGFEIPMPYTYPANNLYAFCYTNIATGPNSTVSLYVNGTSKNACATNVDGGLRVENVEKFNQTNGNNTYRMHILTTPMCPAFELCPPDWFINQDYSVDYTNFGPELRFPAGDLLTNESISILPYNVDITFKLDNPAIAEMVQNYNTSTEALLFQTYFRGPIEPENFLDVDIYLKDGTCASQTFCDRFIMNSTYQTPPGFQTGFYNTRVMGLGAKLENGFVDSSLNIFTYTYFIGPCIDILLLNGFELTDMAIGITINPDAFIGDKTNVSGTDYSDGDYTSDNPYGEIGEDGLTRRFYFMGGQLMTLKFSTFFINSQVTFVPTAECPRQPYTRLDYCNGPCTQFVNKPILFDSTDNITAKAENHPNSTYYDSVGLNSTRVNEQLLEINFPYNETLLQIPPGQVYTDDLVLGASLCNYWSNLLSHDIAVNGTAHVISLNVTLPPEITGGVEYQYAAFMATFKTELLVQALNMFSMTIEGPFPPGVFMTFDNETQSVHVFGTTIGIAIAAHANSTILMQSHCDNDPYCQSYPKPVIMFYDFYVPNVTRDFINADADLISHATEFIPGPFFRQGISPLDERDYGYPSLGPDEPSIGRSLPLCDLFTNTYNPMATGGPGPTVWAYGSTRNFGDAEVEPIPYENLVGNDPNITFRMGNGVDDGGMLGALPVVASLYARSTVKITFMTIVYYFEGNTVGNETTGKQRFRMGLYPCLTRCPRNATHYLMNHPNFKVIDYMTPVASPLVVNATKDTDIFNVSQNQYTQGTPYDEMSTDDILNTLTGNLLGGLAYGFRHTDMVRRVTVTEGTFALVLNFDQTDIGQVIDLIDNQTVKDYVYDILDVTSRDVGLYANMRDTLGSMSFFGIVCGILFVSDVDFPSTYVPYDVVLSTFGLYTTNHNLEFFPILRQYDSNELYLASSTYCNNYTGSCRQTGIIRSYYLSNDTMLDPNDLIKEFGMSFDEMSGEGFTLKSTETAISQNGIGQYTVTGSGNFTPTDSDPLITPYYGGFKFVCVDCWDAFNDAKYFNWKNTCPVFYLCMLRGDTSPAGGECIVGQQDYYNQLNLTAATLSNNTVAVQWTQQNLTASYVARIIMTMSTAKPCTVNATLNGESAVANVYMETTFSVVTSFDGDNLNGTFVFNDTKCGPIISQVTINYTIPIPCPQRIPMSASFSDTPSQSMSTSKTLSHLTSQSLSDSQSRTGSQSKSNTMSQSTTASYSNTMSQSTTASYSNTMSHSNTISQSNSLTQTTASQTQTPEPPTESQSMSRSTGNGGGGGSSEGFMPIIWAVVSGVAGLFFVLFLGICATRKRTIGQEERQPLLGNKYRTRSD